MMKRVETLQSKLCRLKPKTNKENQKDVVYVVKCKTCGKIYIGETSHPFEVRRGQHKRDVVKKAMTNGIFCHIMKNRTHKIDWDTVIFWDKEKHWARRKIKESLFINAMERPKDPKLLMNLDKGWKINSCWTEFQGELQRIGSRKLNQGG